MQLYPYSEAPPHINLSVASVDSCVSDIAHSLEAMAQPGLTLHVMLPRNHRRN